VPVPDPTGNNGPNREFIPTFPQGTREEWARAGGTDVHHISVNATHTHTAPAHFSKKYTSRIEEAIKQTAEKLVPIHIYTALGESGISAFRRPTLHADLSVPVNQTLRVLYFETLEHVPMGAIVNYAVHPTAVRNPVSRISGDIVGLAAAQVESRFGEDFTCLYLQGFSGDICPRYGDNGPKSDTYQDVLIGSRVLAEDVIEALNTKERIVASDVVANTKDIFFPTKEGFSVDQVKVTLMGIAMGPVFVLSVSGEIFNDYISKFDDISPFEFNLFSGVSNGYSGYIPTRKAFLDGLGGYEMNTTPYTEEVEERFVGEVKNFIHSFKG
jgi:neutral ceramidase